ERVRLAEAHRLPEREPVARLLADAAPRREDALPVDDDLADLRAARGADLELVADDPLGREEVDRLPLRRAGDLARRPGAPLLPPERRRLAAPRLGEPAEEDGHGPPERGGREGARDLLLVDGAERRRHALRDQVHPHARRALAKIERILGA